MRIATFKPATLIGIGLTTMIAAACYPPGPKLTALASITLGATEATLTRFRNSPALLRIAILHTAAYAGLYSLFVGATFHASEYSPRLGISVFAVLDLFASAILIAISAQRIIAALRQSLPSQQ